MSTVFAAAPRSVQPGAEADRLYLALLREALETGEIRPDRTGTGTRGLFGRQLAFDLEAGFPLLTTKKLHWKSIVAELLWFLAGDTNARTLAAQGVTIWDEWADPETGDLGPVYGRQWRSWAAPDGRVIDQIAGLLEGLRRDPFSRRHVVSAWNPADLAAMALPPCHCLFQFHVHAGRDGAPEALSCQLYQRSGDLFLGVPFNIASYALLTHLVAHGVGLSPRRFVHTLGDAHLYANHVEQARLQLARAPFAAPRIEIDPSVRDLFAIRPEHIHLIDYAAHPAIPAPVAV